MWTHVGFSNMISTDRIIAISDPDSMPIRRIISSAKQDNKFLDFTQGRKTRSVLFVETKSGVIVVASFLLPETITERIKKNGTLYEEPIDALITDEKEEVEEKS